MNRAAVREKAIALQAAAAPVVPASPVSIQSQVLAAVVAALNAAGTVKAYRTRMAAFKPENLPAYNVLPDEGEDEYTTSGVVDETFRFEIRHIMVAKDEVDAAVDPMYVASCQALGVDPTLGRLVTSLRRTRRKWDLEKGEVAAVALVVTYEVEYKTARFDPSKKVY